MKSLYLLLSLLFLTSSALATEITCTEKMRIRGRELVVKTSLSILGSALNFEQTSIFSDGELLLEKNSSLAYQKDVGTDAVYTGKIENSDTGLDDVFVIYTPNTVALNGAQTANVKLMRLILINPDDCHNESCIVKKWEEQTIKSCSVRN